MKDLSERMKRYEEVYRSYLTKRTPIIIRVDGRAFHSFTKRTGCNKPFDLEFIESMVETARKVAQEMQGFKLAYTQSDEINFLLTDYDKEETQGWFDYNVNKIISISASLVTSKFIKDFFLGRKLIDIEDSILPSFDSRVFNIPKSDVSNYFLWRAKDWERNSLLMYSQSFFSHNEMQNKHKKDLHEMLHSIGKNWNDLPKELKNGNYLINYPEKGIIRVDDIIPTYKEISEVIDTLI
jgi:tRNA(His) guanylyltransferase